MAADRNVVVGVAAIAREPVELARDTLHVEGLEVRPFLRS